MTVSYSITANNEHMKTKITANNKHMKTKTQIRFIYLELLMTNAVTVINRIIKGGSLYKKKISKKHFSKSIA